MKTLLKLVWLKMLHRKAKVVIPPMSNYRPVYLKIRRVWYAPKQNIIVVEPRI